MAAPSVPHMDLSKVKRSRGELIKTARSIDLSTVTVTEGLSAMVESIKGSLTSRQEKRRASGWATERNERVMNDWKNGYNTKEVQAVQAKLDEADAIYMAKKEAREEEVAHERERLKQEKLKAEKKAAAPPRKLPVPVIPCAKQRWFYLDDEALSVTPT